MTDVFVLDMRSECAFGMNEELRLSFPIAFCPFDQSRSAAPE
jgi:hypothetical protein